MYASMKTNVLKALEQSLERPWLIQLKFDHIFRDVHKIQTGLLHTFLVRDKDAALGLLHLLGTLDGMMHGASGHLATDWPTLPWATLP